MTKFALLLAAVALLAVTPAYADSVTDTGSIYNLSYTQNGADSYQFTLTIDASGYSAGDGTDLLNAVAINILKSNATYESYSVVSAPSGYATALVPGALGAGGCNGNSSNYLCLGFVQTPGGVDAGDPGDIYTFVFDIATSANGMKDTSDVKAVYEAAGADKLNGMTTDVYTESIAPTLTPEPSSIAMLGTGLLGMAGIVRRRWKS